MGRGSQASWPSQEKVLARPLWTLLSLRIQRTDCSSLTFPGIPPDVFGYRLGNRSALDWVIDQYRVKTDSRSGITSDPNRPDDPEYIVRLVGQVVGVSLQTVKIVDALPPDFGAEKTKA
ncbi:MAG: type ISP restriction/modification enzyme [Planctomycetota bacterium]